jgi:hypothetical protein
MIVFGPIPHLNERADKIPFGAFSDFHELLARSLSEFDGGLLKRLRIDIPQLLGFMRKILFFTRFIFEGKN